MNKFIRGIIILFWASLSVNAAAQNLGGVFSPVVNDGHESAQYRIAVIPDGPGDEIAWAQWVHYQKAVNDRFMWRSIISTRKTPDSDLDLNFIGGHFFFDMSQTNAKWRKGLRLDAIARDDNRPHSLGLHFMNDWRLADGWSARAVLLTSYDLGPDRRDGVSLQSRFRLFKSLENGHGIGLEWYDSYNQTGNFGDFDSQYHTLGPVYNFPLGNGLSLYGGPLFGLSERAPDVEGRLWVTKRL